MLRRVGLWLVTVAIGALVLGLAQFAGAQNQAPAAARTAPPPTPKASAPIDLTGYWVSIITEDWRWRMVTPPKSDYASIPINLAAKKVGDTWDPAKDESSGEQCKSYGAPAVMRTPERVRITWQDDNTLKLETDAGQQTRLFHFGNWKAPAGAPATWQGDSVAQWVGLPPARRAVADNETGTPAAGRGGERRSISSPAAIWFVESCYDTYTPRIFAQKWSSLQR